MKINIFEGARRVIKLISVILLGVGLFYAFTDKTYIPAYFRIDSYEGIPIRMIGQSICDDGYSQRDYSDAKYTDKGTEVSVTLCFSHASTIKPKIGRLSFKEWKAREDAGTLPQPSTEATTSADEQERKNEDEVISRFNAWKAKQNKTPVPAQENQSQDEVLRKFNEWKAQKDAIMKKAIDNFKFSKDDEEWADGVARSGRWKSIGTNMPASFMGIASLWIFSWCIGWITRGFMSIPSGQDFKS